MGVRRILSTVGRYGFGAKRMGSAIALSASLAGLSALGGVALPAYAINLGVEGQIFEPIEEDFRLTLLRLVARHDWTRNIEGLKESARNYTKNLPDFHLPLAQETKTVWKDVGIIVNEDIYFNTIDWETGSVFEPQPTLAVPAGTYLNPIAQLPSSAIERLFVFDATSPEQLEFAKSLMEKNIPLLNFMISAGDVGPIAKEMNRPVYHMNESMRSTFQITAVPTLIGFGRGEHLGHLATTQFKLPMTEDDIRLAWYGLPYPGYEPDKVEEPEVSPEEAARVRAAFTQAAQKYRESQGQVPGQGPGQ